jgi:transposase
VVGQVALRKNIIHLLYDMLMSPAEIAPLIVSPRVEGGVSVVTVERVIDFFETFWHVEDVLMAPRRRKMPEAHVDYLIEIITRTPWLYLDELAEEIRSRFGVSYSPNLCYENLIHRGYSLKVMRRKARQRDEEKRFQFFLAISEVMYRPSQLVFADEVGQDGRGSRRRRGWGVMGKDLEITEFLNRGAHVSILALYSYTGFLDFDWVEGGYNADDFISAVEFMIIPHLRPYPEDNSILILDNCGIHHAHAVRLRAMVEAVGAKIYFLAPYSPIDNPIEMAFNSFKACWRRNGYWLNDLPLHVKIQFCLDYCGSNGDCAAAAYSKCGYTG